MTKPTAIKEIMAQAFAGQFHDGEPDFADIEAVEAILAALDTAGLAVVPKEATEEMMGGPLPPEKQPTGAARSLRNELSGRAWREMLTAFNPADWKPKT